MLARGLATRAAEAPHRRPACLRALVRSSLFRRDHHRPLHLPARLGAGDRGACVARGGRAPGMASRVVAPAGLRRHPHGPGNRTLARRHGKPAGHGGAVPAKRSDPRHLGGHVGVHAAEGGNRGREDSAAGSRDPARPHTAGSNRRRPGCVVARPCHPQRAVPGGRAWPSLYSVARHRLSDQDQDRAGSGGTCSQGRHRSQARDPPLRCGAEDRHARPADRQGPPAGNRTRGRQRSFHL